MHHAHRISRSCIILSLAITSLAAQPVTGQCQRAQLLPDDLAGADRFGVSTAISGDWVVCGASHDDDGGNASGSAYVFQREGITWVQYAKLTADDAEISDWFGHSASIDGDYLVIGAYGDDELDADDSGSVYVFHLEETVWVQQQKLRASDAEQADQFGLSVAISGDTIVVGAPQDDDGGEGSGSVYVFRRTDATWSQEAKLTPDDPGEDDQFGTAVAIDGDAVIVGVPFDDGLGADAGTAYLFQRTDTTWTQEVELTVDDVVTGYQFGGAVYVNGDVAVIGAWQGPSGGPGAVYILRWDGFVWSEEAALQASDGAPGEQFGRTVAIDGDCLLVTAPLHDGSADMTGAAYIFRYDPGEPEYWTQDVKITAIDEYADLRLGMASGLSGDYAVLGTMLGNSQGPLSGVAYVNDITIVGPDCNDNGIVDECEIDLGLALDCNLNGVPDECDISDGTSTDCDDNGIPDDCEFVDCNNNLLHDACDILLGISEDCNDNGAPDECDIDGGAADCNDNDIPDECELDGNDCDGNGIPDECQLDTDGDGIPDVCDEPVIVQFNLIGADEAWTDPTQSGMAEIPDIQIIGRGLVSDRVEFSNDEYTVVVDSFDVSGPDGLELRFPLPVFPPGSHLDGPLEVTMTIYAAGGTANRTVEYNLVRKTVGLNADYATITDAVADAHDGWAIVVDPITYVVADTIDMEGLSCITIGAQNAHPNIQMIGSTTDIIRFSGNDQTVRLQRIDLTSGHSAIVIEGASSPIIHDCFIKDAQRAIEVKAGSSPFISACIIGPTITSPELDGNAVSITDDSWATIRDSTIIQNLGAARGTIYIEQTTQPVLIANCSIFLNEARSGGAVYVGDGAEALIVGNLIDSNTATEAAGQGGGVYIAAQTPGSQLVIEIACNEFSNNVALGNAECAVGVPGGGGAVFLGENSSPRIVDNLITGNETAVGGAIVVCKGATPLIQRNIITCNTVTPYDDDPDYFAPGIYVYDAEPRILNNVFFANDLVIPEGEEPTLPTLDVSERGGGVHGASLASAGTVFANNIFLENDGWGIYLDSVVSQTFIDILHNDFWQNDETGLCPNCSATTPDFFPGRTFGNLDVDPLLASASPSCTTRDDYQLDAMSPLIGAGLADDVYTFLDSHYVLYHDDIATDIGWMQRDGILAPNAIPLVLEAREIASHARIEIEVQTAASIPVIIESSAATNLLDGSLVFHVDATIEAKQATEAVRFSFGGTAPGFDVADIELPWAPPVDSDNRVALVIDVNDDLTFETIADIEGTIDGASGVVRFEDVPIADVENHWIAGVIGLVGEAPPCLGDLDGDRDVDQSDLGILLADYLIGPGGDLDSDGDTDQNDLGILLAVYGLPCP
ncbi:MAG: right-handed parallel beta-helix repeat-containing protein [Phycisphaerales bacterium]|nr:right-handed parallel beta-helix repeat-containing protein [Phycisphaerales bacterium]